MVTKNQIDKMYGYLRLVHKTTRRIVLAFPDDKLDWVPKAGMRTPRELIEHIYGQGLAKADRAYRGEMTYEQYLAYMTAPRSGGAKQLLDWCDATFEAMMARIDGLTEAQVNDTVMKAFFGDFQTGVFLSITYDEWWHHRGQLTIYLRLLGIPVPNIYDYGE